ncbi:hypothetical protein [Vibrio aerogenes]|nr:hypothetical protein [Vibrio aerogenes]
MFSLSATRRIARHLNDVTTPQYEDGIVILSRADAALLVRKINGGEY